MNLFGAHGVLYSGRCTNAIRAIELKIEIKIGKRIWMGKPVEIGSEDNLYVGPFAP